MCVLFLEGQKKSREAEENKKLVDWRIKTFGNTNLTWAELFDSSIVVWSVDWQEILKPGNFWVRVATSCTEHGGGPGTLYHFQLGAHVYGGEPRGKLVLWNRTQLYSYIQQGTQKRLSLSFFFRPNKLYSTMTALTLLTIGLECVLSIVSTNTVTYNFIF